MRKMRHKVCNGQNLPHESLNFTNYFFQSDFTYNLRHFSPSLRPHYQNSFFLNIVFYSKLQDVWKHVYLASQIVLFQNGRRSNFYMVQWTLIYCLNFTHHMVKTRSSRLKLLNVSAILATTWSFVVYLSESVKRFFLQPLLKVLVLTVYCLWDLSGILDKAYLLF